ncbi:MAG TPA: hypothetical protein IGS37_14365 [Synechococcales cyanobacterium M55_K2018_004]|nr:hypothetical protein [Synechococcales cyanobacterium M55_K2018_004]
MSDQHEEQPWDASDPTFQQQLERLHQFTVYFRWAVVGVLWLLLGPISLWMLRSEIQMWREYFTWTALRYGLAYNLLPTLALSICVGATVAVLLWQSRNILFGISPRQTRRLTALLWQIRKQGESHPLWRWVNSPQSSDSR